LAGFWDRSRLDEAFPEDLYDPMGISFEEGGRSMARAFAIRPIGTKTHPERRLTLNTSARCALSVCGTVVEVTAQGAQRTCTTK